MTSPPARGTWQQQAGQDQDPAKGAARDRDSSGRPRNARPRDELGRPLSRSAPGELPYPGEPPYPDELPYPGESRLPAGPPEPDEPALPPASALALAQQLIDQGRAFRAHEVLEASWKAAEPAERDLWKGLAQVAVGLTHAQRGNARGAVTLLRRGAGAVGGYAGGCPHGIDAAGIVRSARELADRIERNGLAALSPDRLVVRLGTAVR
jgi:uncharacterized protein